MATSNHSAESDPSTQEQTNIESSALSVELFNSRVEEAINGSEFDTSNPEIAASIEGFYADHYGLASIVDSALEGELDTETVDFLLDSFKELQSGEIDDSDQPTNYSIAYGVFKLAESVKTDLETNNDGVESDEFDNYLPSGQTLATAAQCVNMLFREDSIGVTTVGDSEVNSLRRLHTRITEKITETAQQEGSDIQVAEERDSLRIFYRNDRNQQQDVRLGSVDKLGLSIDFAKQEFWNDVRYAGQLEFHNTGFLGKVYQAGGLMPRTEQYRRGHGMSAQMESEKRTMHSNVPHFSEGYDPKSYKNGSQDRVAQPGTLAIPLEKIIMVAPFARDAEYAIVEFNGEADAHVNSGVHNIGHGSFDQPGMSSQDRVFLLFLMTAWKRRRQLSESETAIVIHE